MGLLSPTEGFIYIDGKKLNLSCKNNFMKRWRYSVAYVPQQIFLTDNTIGANIAFGLSNRLINKELIREAVKANHWISFQLFLKVLIQCRREV